MINAGDGAHEHPTQALLDALTIRRNKGGLDGLLVAICGDILHSRVARSNIMLLNAMGARVRVVAPSTLLPPGIERFGVEVARDMREGLAGADIVMMLRLQRERMNGSFVPSMSEYFHYFGLDEKKLAYAKPDALVMHPGPMNRGVEIDSDRRRRRAVADPRTGRDGRRGAHGGAGSAVARTCRMRDVACCRMTRRPILLANARIVDPSRDLDFAGDLLIADGVIREAKRGIGAAGVPEGTEVDRLPRQAGRARPGRHARLHRRARRRAPRDLRLGEPGRRRRRRHHHHLPARHHARDRRSGDRRFRAAPRARHRDRARASDGGADQGPRTARR